MLRRIAISGCESRDKMFRTAAYYVAFVTLGISVASLGPSLPSLAERTGTQLRDVSLLFAAFPLGRLLGFLTGGQLYDRVPGHIAMALSLVIGSVMLALVPLMPSLELLVLVVLFLGMYVGVLGVGANTLLMWVHRYHVGPYMNGMHFCYGIGALLAPVVIAQVTLLSGDIVLGYLALGLLMWPAVLILFSLPSPRNPVVLEYSVDKKADAGLVLLIALFFFFFNGAEFAFGWWIFTYATALGIGTAVSAAYLTSLFFGAMALGRLLAAGLLIRLAPRFVLWGALLVSLASTAVILLGSGSQPAIWAGTLGVGLSIGPLFPTMLAFAQRRMAITARVTSLIFVGVSAGTMTLPWLVGQVFEYAGPHMIMIVIALALAVATAIFGIVVRVKPIGPTAVLRDGSLDTTQGT